MNDIDYQLRIMDDNTTIYASRNIIYKTLLTITAECLLGQVVRRNLACHKINDYALQRKS